MSFLYGNISRDIAILAVDSRCSRRLSDGSFAVVGDNYRKLAIGKNYALYGSGDVQMVELAINELLQPVNGVVNMSDYRLIDVVKKYHSLYTAYRQRRSLPLDVSEDGTVLSLGLSLTKYDPAVNGIINITVSPYNNFEPVIADTTKHSGTCDIMFGFDDDEWCNQNKESYPNIIDYIRALFKHANSPTIGGELSIFTLDASGCRHVLSEPIPDKQEYKRCADGLICSGGLVYSDSLYLNKNIVLQWTSDNSPTKTLYAQNEIAKPTNKYSAYPSASSKDWHTTFDKQNDYYVSYSYDGGNTWTDAVKYQARDGQDGSNGTVDYNEVSKILKKDYKITSTEIDGTHIESPIIESAELHSAKIYGAEMYTNSLAVFDDPDEKSGQTGISLHGKFKGEDDERFYIKYWSDSMTTPITTIQTNGTALWNSAQTTFSGLAAFNDLTQFLGGVELHGKLDLSNVKLDDVTDPNGVLGSGGTGGVAVFG